MGLPGRQGSGSPCWLPAGGAAAQLHRTLLTAVLLLGAVLLPLPVDGQTLEWEAGFPKLDITYDWSIKAAAGSGPAASTASFTVTRASSVEIPYTINVVREAGETAGTLSFKVTCPSPIPGGSQGVEVKDGSGAAITSGQTDSASQQARFQNVKWPTPPKAASNEPAGRVNVRCLNSGNQDGTWYDVVFASGNTKEVRDTAVLTDTITWPDWTRYFPQGGWLTATPAVAVTRGTQPSGGITVRGSVTYEYTQTISNMLLCFSTAPVTSVATLVAGTGADQRKYQDTTSVTLTVTGCDVQPTIVMDQPNLQTSLTFAWSQSLTAVSPAAIRVPWGGGGAVEMQAVFTRTVTSATFLASFALTITNPVPGPIALTNLQLACPWGGNTLLPCGAMAAGGVGVGGGFGGTNQYLVIPAAGSVQCMVNNLQIAATWGNDFTQPCTIITSNWLGTQTTLQGVVLDFAAPTRWQLINNCATWSVTCSQPTGNPVYLPAVGGLPTGKQVCGNDQSNSPLPPQPFSVGLSGGWVGPGYVDDGTDDVVLPTPMALAGQPTPVVLPTRTPNYISTMDPCASSVTTTCTSQLQLQSTQGTTQNFGGVQANTMSVQATPVDCPRRPRRPPVVVAPMEPVLASTAPLGLMSASPIITTAVTKTLIKGSFTWSVKTQLSPASQAIAQGSSGVMGTYTVTAAPTPVPGSNPEYQLQGMVTVQNPPGNTVPMTVQQVNVVVDTAQVPLVCPGLPGTLAPGQVSQCGFLVNYNKGPAPNAVFGRVTDATGRSIGDGSPVLFSFDTADATGARGGCARVYQTFATNWFDLVQVTGVAPSFTSEDPTTVCSPATWTFDVRFTPRELAPCGVQQAVQTVTASYTSEAAAQDSVTANLYVTGESCDPAPADFLPVTSSGGGPTSNPGPGPTSAPTGQGTASPGSSPEGEPLPAGVSVVVSDVQQQRSSSPAWELAMEPADNVTLTAGKAATVGFKLRWSKTKPLTDYSGTVTVINNAPDPAQLDGLYINLMDSMGSGDATAEALPECPVDASGSLQPVTASNPFTLAAFGRISCKFVLKSTYSGALVGTATLVDGEEGIVSKPVAVTSLMADSSCSKLVSGMAASELGPDGVLFAPNGTTEEDVCSPSSKVIQVSIPADANTDKGCSFPVVALAWIKPDTDLSSPGTIAFAKSDVKIAGCSSSQLAGSQAVAALTGVSITKGRALRWVVSIETDPPVSTNETVEEETLAVTTTWRQASELRLNVSGEVAIKGSGSVTKAQVLAIPLCGASAGPDCKPVPLEVNCKTAPDSKDASRCIFNLTRLLALPGLLLPSADQVQPAAAQPYDLARARYGGRPVPQCAVLSEQRSLEPLEGAPAAEVAVAGASALSSEPFCGLEQSRNYTLSFSSIECGNLYAFATSAAAKPVSPGLPEATADLAFDVTC